MVWTTRVGPDINVSEAGSYRQDGIREAQEIDAGNDKVLRTIFQLTGIAYELDIHLE
jgi:hypothetical protein